jgi:hypothetical protein
MDCEISFESDAEQMKKSKKTKDQEKQIAETFLNKGQEIQCHATAESPLRKSKIAVRFRLSGFRFIGVYFVSLFLLSLFFCSSTLSLCYSFLSHYSFSFRILKII